MEKILPVTGAWRPGDPPGLRRFVTCFESRPHILEAGGRLSDVTIAYETWGDLAPDGSNAVLVLHALTGDSHASGVPTPEDRRTGWWNAVVGPGRPLDTNEWFVVAPNVLGGCQGTTGPSSPAEDGRPIGSRFPCITIRDQVVVEAALADALGIDTWAAVVGGSMGGMRALEWAVSFPERVRRAVVLAVGGYATAEQIALCSVQSRAIRFDPRWRGGDYYDAAPGDGPWEGIELARSIGHITYRSELELEARFGRLREGRSDAFEGEQFAVESYLEHHGRKLVERFDANSYLVLNDAMNSHDVGRGRGGLAAALARITAEVSIGGISSDRLYPIRLQHELGALIPHSHGPEVIESVAGHDGFLVESDAVGKLVANALAG
ncbi:MAG: homoserine O-acetyltransferase [Actinomycetia bacterium]|nr:homoserine O-acetyltransferase [Actinomycetes bacterium]